MPSAITRTNAPASGNPYRDGKSAYFERINATQESENGLPDAPRGVASTTVTQNLDFSGELERLARHAGALGVSLWRFDAATETIKLLYRSNVLEDAWTADIEDNCEVAVRTQNVMTRVLTGDPSLVVVSRVLPFEPDTTLSFVRQQTAAGGSMSLPQSTIENAANRMALLVAHARISELESQPDSVSKNEAVSNKSTRTWWKLANLSTAKKVAIGCIACCLLGSCPWPYKLNCDAVCEPANRRIVSVPFDSRLTKTYVVPGQSIAKGDLLATLDSDHLKSQLTGAEAELLQAKQRHHTALSQGDAAEAGIQRFEVARLQEVITQLQQQIDATEIRSPIDGVVVSGDLHGIQGASLAIGNELFEIAPLDRIRVELAIPEEEITDIDDSAPTRIYLTSLPNETISANIARLHPRSEIRDKSSVFIGEVEIENTDHKIRPGMRGNAKIDVGYRAVGTILLRKPYLMFRRLFGW